MKNYNFWQQYKNILILFPIMLLLAIIGHSFYIYRFITEGTIITGPNDGLEQMLPMQKFIYEKVMSGQLFYSNDFGLGGDYYTDLSYYYSTSVVFFINMIGVKFLDLFLNFKTDTITFWAKNAFYISILKSTVAMTFSYLYFRQIKMSKGVSYLASFLFVISAIYFRFTLYWSFFSDVFIFLPLLLLSIEVYIQKNNKGLFMLTVALILINNFYFAYQLMIVGIIYFIFRNILKHNEDIVSRKQQWIDIIIMTVISFLASLFSFFYGVKGFMGNERESYDEKLQVLNAFDQHGNIFYDNYLIIVIFMVIPALLTFKFYKDYWYKFFAVTTIILMLLSLTPFTDSLFNGFSAPQKRWHYLIMFFSSGLIGMYIQKFKSVTIHNYILSCIPAIIILLSSQHFIYKSEDITWVYISLITMALGLGVLSIKEIKLSNIFYILMIASLFILNLDIIRLHNILDNYNKGINDRAKMSYIESSVYDSALQRQIVKDLKKEIKPDERIDYRVLEQDNTPMYQGFKGVSLYSSIFDGNIIDFYYNDLMINLKHESISRYSTFQSRSNLESLFNVKYLVRKDYQTDIPENFKLYKDYGKYKVYENTLPIGYARIVNNIYNENELSNPLDREHAMLNGIVTKSKDLKSNSKINKNKNIFDKVKITLSGATWVKENEEINIDASSGGLILDLPKKYKNKDIYLEMYVSRISAESNFQINVNGYANERLFKSSKYRTKQDNLLYRVKPNDKGNIIIALTGGQYKFNIKGIYVEDYKLLKKINKKSNLKYDFKDNGRKMKFTLKGKHKKGYLVTPIVYREGMTSKVDGKKTDIIRANYLMSSVKVDENSKEIIISYLPPYFKTMLFLSFVGLLLMIYYSGLYKYLMNKRGGTLDEFEK